MVERDPHPPKQDRPLLPHEIEAQFAEIDARSAAIYTRLEYLGDELLELADVLGDRVGVVRGTMPNDASAVVNLRKARTIARKPSE